MAPRLLLALTASTLSLGAFSAAVPVAAQAQDSTAESARSMAKAESELARGRTERAVSLAERAVEAAPMNGDARELLARAYLSDGRLSSAEAAYRDILRLTPGDGAATLNLALVRAALGDGVEARALLDGAALSDADRGLALVLAGDVAGGGALLEAAARAQSADGRVRQNLAFAYALAGDWRRARVVASQDLAPAAVNNRIGEWAAIARPRNSWDQVAYLLAIRPVEDEGMPDRLALRLPTAPTARAEQVAASAPAPDLPPPLTFEAEAAAVPVVVAVPAPPAPTPASTAVSRPVVQALASAPAPAPTPVMRAAVSKPVFKPASLQVKAPAAAGRYVVQLGSFVTPGAAERGWAIAAGRADLRNAAVLTESVVVGGRRFTRLSAGRFAGRAEADALCRTLKSRGGECFVRAVGGDAAPRWAARARATVASR